MHLDDQTVAVGGLCWFTFIRTHSHLADVIIMLLVILGTMLNDIRKKNAIAVSITIFTSNIETKQVDQNEKSFRNCQYNRF